MTFRLRITEGKGVGKEFFFTKQAVRIGRLPDNDLVLYDTGVSRYHCEIVREPNGRFAVRDTGSANGTLLNGTLATEAQIKDGDRIGVGPITFTFASQVEPPREASTGGSVGAPEDVGQRRQIEEGRTRAIRSEELGIGKPVKGDAGDTTRGPLSVWRTATGSFVAYRRKMGSRFAGLPRATRLVLLAGAALVAGAVTVSAWLVRSRPPRDRSLELFPITEEPLAQRFGSGKVDVYTPDKASFQFGWEGGRAVLSYSAGGVESSREIEILVNGQRVGWVAASPSWSKGLETHLPRRLLVPGSNVITFDNALTPGTDERWGISQVQLVQSELPKADAAKAKDLYDLGKATFETYSVAPNNLYRAVKYLEDARLYLEALEPPPPLAADIEKALAAAEKKLEEVHAQYLFTAQKAHRFGDTAQAADALRELLRFYPDPNDRRHQDVKARLQQLSGAPH